MTTTVTVTAGDKTAYVYTALLNDQLDGEFVLAAELFDETRTFHVHSSVDLTVTENPLASDEDDLSDES